MSVVSDRSSVLEDRSDHRRRAWGRRGLRAGVAVIGLAALSLSSAALPASAAGNTWYVSPEGSDAPGCGGSAAEACATIAAALTQVTPDDVVAIAAGSYSEALEITTPVSLQGAGPGDVTISHPGTDDVPTVLVDAEGEVSISGVSLTGSSSMAPGTPIVHVAPGRAATLTTVAVAGDGASSLAGVWADQDSTVAIENSTITSVGYGVTGGGTDPGAGPATVSLTTTTITATLVGVTMAAGVATIQGGSVSGEIGAGLVGASNVTFNVTGTSILDSGAPEGGTFSGGVVLQGGGTFFGDGVTISGNKNGIMLPSGGDVTLVGSTVSENISDAAGGGIYGRPGTTTGGDEIPFTLSLTDTAIERNHIGLSLDNPETVEILNSTISNNLAGIVAATQAPDATLTITDSEVLNNTGALTPGAPSYTGTGISLEGPLEVDVTNTEIDGNLTGILANYATVTITGGSISDNDWVGLFAIEEPHSELRSTVTLTGTAIERNGLDAPTAAVFGLGGIATNFFASVTGSNVTLTGNAIGATISGGTLALTDSVIRDSVISSFDDVVQVPITGHGILASGQGSEWPGQVELVRTEVSGNERDGILLSETAAGTLLTSTVANNGGTGITRDPPTDVPGDPVAQPLLVAGSTIADNTGGALLLTEDTTVDVIASIVQAADGVPACAGPQASLTDLGFNIVSDPSCGFELESTVVGDPQLGPLADNGGPSQTMLPAAESPALDLVPVGTSAPWAGSSIELCPGTFDQRGDGFPRHVRTGCDAGAVELAGAVLTVTASDATYAGEPGPTVTPSYAGFVNGDSAADLDTLPTCSFDVDAAITLCSGAEDDFYSFSYVDGTLTVLEPVEILTESLPVGTVGEDYAVTLEATGGSGAPYTWAITDGALPTGLSLNSGTGEISGVPEEAGDFDLTVSADGDATKAFTLMVSGPVLTVTASDATTYEGAFEPEITASYTGFLPGDSEADLETLPTCTYDMGAATTSCSGAADDLYSFEYVNGTLTVLDPLVIVTESLPGATVGEEYSVTLEATGGDGGPYLWGIHAGSLPAGLQIDPATGEISGIPETAGPVTFTVFVGDPILKEFTLEVAAAPTQPTTPPTTDEPSATDPPATDDPSTHGPGTDGPGAVDDGAEGLPGTGIDGLGAAALALAVMMLGAALVLVARRRRQLG